MFYGLLGGERSPCPAHEFKMIVRVVLSSLINLFYPLINLFQVVEWYLAGFFGEIGRASDADDDLPGIFIIIHA